MNTREPLYIPRVQADMSAAQRRQWQAARAVCNLAGTVVNTTLPTRDRQMRLADLKRHVAELETALAEEMTAEQAGERELTEREQEKPRPPSASRIWPRGWYPGTD